MLHLNLYCPRLTRSKKQLLVRLLTEAFVVAVQQRHWEPVIHINEHPYDNVGVGGQLLSDAYPECAARKFYYELSEA
ncbi:MAG: tautomerase family protein [Candidatus Melainabacteria bacterium]|nr:tautomerase family protein [Candidatus Melainabacteria bacterium]